MSLYMKMSQNINKTMRHCLKNFVIFRFLQIFYGLKICKNLVRIRRRFVRIEI